MTEDQVDSEIRAIIRAAIAAGGDEWRTAVLSYCSSFDRNLADGDSRMLRENIASLRFYAQHGRAPDLSELRNAMGGMSDPLNELTFWCQPCRSAGIIHCSDPIRCGFMAEIPIEEASTKFAGLRARTQATGGNNVGTE
jgi:hypothetical protein